MSGGRAQRVTVERLLEGVFEQHGDQRLMFDNVPCCTAILMGGVRCSNRPAFKVTERHRTKMGKRPDRLVMFLREQCALPWIARASE